MQHSTNQPNRSRPIISNSPHLNLSPVHICLATCDKHIYWLQGRSFIRKLIPEPEPEPDSEAESEPKSDHLKTSTSTSTSASDSASSSSDIPFNTDFGGAGKTHLCYIVHQREDGTYPRTCIFNAGSPVVQVPSSGASRGNVFNSLYWRRCDGTLKNALDEVLVSSEPASDPVDGAAAGGNPGNSDKVLQTSMSVSMVRLRDVLEPKMERVSERDLAKFERWKDAFVQRFM